MDHHESKLWSSSTDNIRIHTSVFYFLALTGLRWNRDAYELLPRVAKRPRILAWNGGQRHVCVQFCFLNPVSAHQLRPTVRRELHLAVLQNVTALPVKHVASDFLSVAPRTA